MKKLQDKLGQQNFHKSKKKVLKPVTDAVKQTVQEIFRAVQDTAEVFEQEKKQMKQ